MRISDKNENRCFYNLFFYVLGLELWEIKIKIDKTITTIKHHLEILSLIWIRPKKLSRSGFHCGIISCNAT